MCTTAQALRALGPVSSAVHGLEVTPVLIGVPREIKNHEQRVALTPVSVRELTALDHEVIVETNAGLGAGAPDADYEAAGAKIVQSAAEVFAAADMVVKVKEPQASERALLRPGQLLFTYLHLAPDPDQARDLVESGAVCVAYETVTSAAGGLPLLAPMSKVAGRLSIQAAAWALQSSHGGAGMLMGGVPGVPPAKVVIIGGGVVGEHAATMAIGLGSDVTVLDRNVDVMDRLERGFRASIKTVYSTRASLEELVVDADVVVGAVLVPGHKAPKLVTAEMVKAMRHGSVLVDVAIDQGGAFETSHPTTHADPIYVVDGVVHYAVANMPGAVPKTSTYALNNATLPFIVELATHGATEALHRNEHLRNGLNVCHGHITEPAVAEDLGYDYVPPLEALATKP